MARWSMEYENEDHETEANDAGQAERRGPGEAEGCDAKSQSGIGGLHRALDAVDRTEGSSLTLANFDANPLRHQESRTGIHHVGRPKW